MLGKPGPKRERRTDERRPFHSYMQFKNDVTGELVGDLAEISRDGFLLECTQPLRVNSQFRFRVDMPPGISGPSRITIAAQCRWQRQHPLDPRVYLCGFQIQRLDAAEQRAFDQIYAQCRAARTGTDTIPDYLWKD